MIDKWYPLIITRERMQNKYMSRFALPVFDSSGEIERYNIFQVVMIVRHAEDGKMYLYDMMDIKKETSNLFQS